MPLPPASRGRSASRLAALVVTALGLAGCDFHGDALLIEPEFDDVSSFEAADPDRWTGRALDLGTPPATWEVTRSGDRASQGSQSTRLRIGNTSGQAKAFIERHYDVEKGLTYLIDMSFDFATADFGGVNAWGLVAGAALDSPTQSGVVVVPGDTGNGRATDEGYVWIQKRYTMELTTDADGELFVFVGVAGTSAFTRAYYVDNVKVSMTRKGISPPR